MAPLPSQLLNVRFAYIPANILKRTRVRQKVAKATYSTQNTTSETTNPFGPVVPIFQHAEKFPNRLALRDRFGDYTFQGLYRSSHQFAKQISDSLNGKTQERVAFLCHNDASYVIAQWACWMSGQIAVPITSHHPPALQEYYINNSEASILVTTPDFVDDVRSLANKTNSKVIVLEDELCSEASKHNEPNQQLPQITLEPSFYQDSDALMIYTSGTTGNPKGVVITHSNLHAQVSCLIEAWGWTENDSILHVLPLHHIHGIVNVLLCSLASGARCVMLPRFDAPEVWNHLLRDNVSKNAEINMFMAVPTIYVKLLEEYDKMVASDPGVQERVLNTCSEKIRLMVSGSAPLPVPLFRRWEQVSGHKLLERFGMSETGMVISNPLNGKRKPGFVGNPLPGMEVQIVRQDNNNKYEVLVHGSSKGTTVLSNETTSGDLMVRGPNVFRGYWKMPEATKKEFTEDGWFKTGDSAQYIEGAYKIQGRTSVDIIKTGGYKVSALEIETHLLGHPDILDCAVIGLPDPTWGQKVAVVIVTRGGKNMTLVQLREWGKRRMAPYAVPTTVKVVETIPKNAMGKVNKKELIKAVFPDALKT